MTALDGIRKRLEAYRVARNDADVLKTMRGDYGDGRTRRDYWARRNQVARGREIQARVNLMTEYNGKAADDVATALDLLDSVLELHRESHNELERKDRWPSGHCNHDGEPYPCSTRQLIEPPDRTGICPLCGQHMIVGPSAMSHEDWVVFRAWVDAGKPGLNL